MASNCARCGSVLDNPKDNIKCSECGDGYHSGCSRIGNVDKLNRMRAASKASWKCDNCAGDSVSSRSDGEATNDQPVLSMLKSIQTDMNKRFDDLIGKHSTMEANLASLTDSYSGIRSTMDVIKKEFGEHQKVVDKLREENETLTREVSTLKQDIQELQQYTRRNNLEVKGIPVTAGEDVYSILQSIAHALGVCYNRADISTAHRLGNNRRGNPPPIIMAFISRSTKEVWFGAVKKRRRTGTPLTTKDLRPSLPEGLVFINEHLSPYNKGLLGAAREMVKKERLAYAWSNDGRIMVRQTTDSKAVRVKQVSDLAQFDIS